MESEKHEEEIGDNLDKLQRQLHSKLENQAITYIPAKMLDHDWIDLFQSMLIQMKEIKKELQKLREAIISYDLKERHMQKQIEVIDAYIFRTGGLHVEELMKELDLTD